MRPEKLSEPIGCNYRLSFHKDVWRYEVEVDSTDEAINLLSKYANDDEELYSEGSLEAGNFTFDFCNVYESGDLAYDFYNVPKELG